MFSGLNDGFFGVSFCATFERIWVNWTRSGRIWMILTRTVNKLTVLQTMIRSMIKFAHCCCAKLGFAFFLWVFWHLLWRFFYEFEFRFTDGPAHFGLQKHYKITVSKINKHQKNHTFEIHTFGEISKKITKINKKVYFLSSKMSSPALTEVIV